MSVLNRTTSRLAKAAVVGAVGAAIAIGSTACSAGKITQTTNQLPAVNGAAGTAGLSPTLYDGEELSNGSIAVRNVQIVYPAKNTEDVFAKGGPFDIAFSIANDSPTRKVKLTGISGPAGSTITVTAPKASTKPTSSDPEAIQNEDALFLAPNQGILAGVPAFVDTAAAQAADIHRLTVTLTNSADVVALGVTIPLVFTFDVYDLADKKVEQKSITVDTPVDAGNLKARLDVVRDQQNSFGGEH